MSLADGGRRVALLARPGAARDCVRDALVEVGAQVVAEDDPMSADVDAVRDTGPQVVMVVLDAASEDALGRFDLLLGDPGIEVMFEEADVAVAREGWEAARWRRHLAAKLHHRDDVLPPSAAVAEVPGIDPLSTQLAELIAADEAGAPLDAGIELPPAASAGDDFSIFDPVAAESAGADDPGYVLGVQGLELDAGALDVLPPVTGPGYSASDFDPLLAELDAELPDSPASSPGDWQGGLVEDFGAAAPAPDREGDTARAVSDDTAAAPAAGMGFGELSLAEDDGPVPAVTAVRHGRFGHDLEDLERRISSLQLLDEALASPGAVLVMAGLGGPDAVRQLLGALPADFRRPVLVRQRLDGARYDKLVTQLRRATTLPVELAVAGAELASGTVYVVGDDIGLESADGLRFAAGSGDTLIDALPPAGSAVVLLSGSDPADVDRIAALAPRGAMLAAQAADGCYDATAPSALAAHGAVRASPAELARQLAGRWNA